MAMPEYGPGIFPDFSKALVTERLMMCYECGNDWWAKGSKNLTLPCKHQLDFLDKLREEINGESNNDNK